MSLFNNRFITVYIVCIFGFDMAIGGEKIFLHLFELPIVEYLLC